MSAAPSPEHRSPSITACSLPLGGTVSRWPAISKARGAAERGARDDVVADTCRLEVPGARRGPLRRSSASSSSSWLTDAMSTSSAVSWSRPSAALAHAGGPVLAEDLVQHRLVVTLAGRQVAHDEHARQEELTARVLLAPHRADGDAPRRHVAAPELVSRPGVDHRDRRVEDGALAEHGPLADAGALGDHGPAADQHVVLDDDRSRVGRLEHAADADAPGEVHPLADLCAGPDGRPGVDHRVRARRGRRC